MLAKMETNQERMDANIEANQEKMEAKIEADDEKFEVLRGTLVSRMDIHKRRTVSNEVMKARTDIYQEKLESAINSSGPS
jgi:hypothetical protein